MASGDIVDLEALRHTREVAAPCDVQVLAHGVRPECQGVALPLESEGAHADRWILARDVGTAGEYQSNTVVIVVGGTRDQKIIPTIARAVCDRLDDLKRVVVEPPPAAREAVP